MNQSGFVAGGLLLGFVLFLAIRGRLGTYGAVLWGPTAAPVPAGGAASGSSGGGIGGIVSSVATKGLEAAAGAAIGL